MKCPQCGEKLARVRGTVEPNDWYWLCGNADCLQEEAIEVETPRRPRCPDCGSDTLDLEVPWSARSMDSCDPDNTAVLDEYRCLNDACCISFWK